MMDDNQHSRTGLTGMQHVLAATLTAIALASTAAASDADFLAAGERVASR